MLLVNQNKKKDALEMSLLELFCDVDDFCQIHEAMYEQHLLSEAHVKRIRRPKLSVSEMMTIIIHFHQSSYRTFKAYYTKHVMKHLTKEFPDLVSYNRFVALMPRVGILLMMYLNACKGQCTGISFVDATSIAVCHNRRIARHRVFDGLAERGKTTMGWFYGFKLHLIVNEYGELVAFQITPGNVDDRKPVPKMCRDLFGKLFGDKGYLSKTLFQELWEDGVQLITMVRSNMKNQLVVLQDKLLSRKRSIIETINDQLKNISQIEHSRHRSINNFFVNLIVGLIAYCYQEKKPSLNLTQQQTTLLPVIA